MGQLYYRDPLDRPPSDELSLKKLRRRTERQKEDLKFQTKLWDFLKKHDPDSELFKMFDYGDLLYYNVHDDEPGACSLAMAKCLVEVADR